MIAGMKDDELDRPGRARRRELIKAIRLPHVSGKASAAWLVACFALTAALIPTAVRLPLWIDFEIVLAVWWLVWAGVLTRLLYLGWHVSDDHRLGTPRTWFGSGSGSGGRTRRTSSSGWFDLGFWDLSGGEGCVWVLGLVLAVVVLLGAAWFVVEVAVPLVAFLLYWTVRGMLAAVLNDDHRCQGRLAAAAGRGLLWATVYTAPLAGVVWLVHHFHAARG
jgi:hypothetical protein